MTRAESIKATANLIMQSRDRELKKHTDECLVATCMFRYVFQRKHNRKPVPAECPRTCPYHIEPLLQSSPGRSRGVDPW